MKAILIIDMPVNCRECPCFYDYLHCQAKAGLNVLADKRPKGCPLKPIPDKACEKLIDGLDAMDKMNAVEVKVIRRTE